MRFPRIFRGELSIAGRLMAWFLAIALIPVGVTTLVIARLSTLSLEQTVRRELLVISEAKAAALETFVQERRRDVTVAGQSPSIINAARTLEAIIEKSGANSPEYEKAAGPVEEALSVYRDTYDYANAYLFANDGTLLARIEPGLDIGPNLLEGPLKQSELADLFTRSRMLLDAVVTEYQIYPGSTHPMAFVGHPVLDAEGVCLGVVALQFDNEELYQTLSDYTGLGATGEIQALRRSGEDVVLIAPTRFEPDAAFQRRITAVGDTVSGAWRAVSGQRGFAQWTDYRGHQAVGVYSYVPSLRIGLVVKMDRAEAYELITAQRTAVAALLLATIVLVAATARLVARSLSRPISAAVTAAHQVAHGDLTAILDVEAKGEIGTLICAIRTMTCDLRGLIGKIQKSSISLLSTATEIAATSRQQEQTMHEHGTSTNQVAAAVKEISATSQELLRTMNELNQVASRSTEMATDGQRGLSLMDQTMRTLAESTSSISSKLSVISERAAGINLAVTTITKVADQTNLLSINAAIEAEKAGEYGLGFLVVAREIRRLADMTAVSTLDIERMVKEMQYSVSAGVMEMDKFSDQVRQGVREAVEVNDKLSQIINDVQVLTTRFEHVTEGMRVQSQGADQIREAVARLSDGTNQTLASLREFNQATGTLREAVGGLKDEVSRFRVEAPTT